MKVGIMGGTFDPIHIGHLIAASSAVEAAGLDEAWFMPSHIPPHKDRAPKASAAQRWDMVCRAVEDHPKFKPADVELQMGGVSYSVETVKRLCELYPSHQMHYIIGADMVQFLSKWFQIDEIVKRIGFIGLQRPGTALDLSRLPEHIRQAVVIVPMPLIDISSTLIRERATTGKSARYFVPDRVFEYIEVNRLYEA
ncbi:nicotinate-nucleotide adenylyltransferase [Paenibacillus thalictri]|uniref:Probable nicotinate-nucleotide adenylyltransferase n=1 Tax=Paenibacillus thalictri TaxID=2527873 RepID=A0A4Q9DMP3_9BACL|nr:nicotinate-nucleotide adenylyltransferase [Paenibacillus thalictri]TBL75369.1 nicotinate-nucleotide adenylyltransferase [Paenibacillus thalictri]